MYDDNTLEKFIFKFLLNIEKFLSNPNSFFRLVLAILIEICNLYIFICKPNRKLDFGILLKKSIEKKGII